MTAMPSAHSGVDGGDVTKRKKRAPMSCDRCKARKTKCIDPIPGPCRFCASIGASCRTDPNRRRQRPYYHVSEEEFRYMTRVLRHFVPDTELNLKSLKSLAESLGREGAPNDARPSPAQQQQQRRADAVPVDHPSASDQQEEDSTSPAGESVTIDELGVLYGRLAWLTVDSTGTYRHVGAHSAFGFNAAVRAVKQGGNPPGIAEKDVIGPLRAGNLPPATPESSIGLSHLKDVHLPPKELAFLYSNRFFAEVHSVYWFFSTEQFYSKLESTYAEEGAYASSSWLCSLYSIFALCSEGVGRHDDNSLPPDRSTAEYYSMAKALVPSVCDEADIGSVRALCLLALALQSSSYTNAAYLFIGTAARIAFSLGLHLTKSPSSRSSLEKEYDRRIWCTLYMLDLDSSLRYGNPCAISEENAPTELQVPSEFILSPGASMPLNYLALSCELSRLKRQISHILYVRARTESQNIPISQVSKCLSSLKAWRESMPGHLRHLNHAAAVHKRSVGALHLQYWSAVLFATRPFLLYSALYGSQFASVDKKKWFDELGSICTDAAQKSLDVLKQLAAEKVLSSLTVLDCTCALEDMQVLVLSLEKTGDAAYKAQIRECIDVLSAMECVRWTKHALTEALNQLSESGVLDDATDGQIGRDALNQSFITAAQEHEIFPNFLDSTNPDWWDCLEITDCTMSVSEASFGSGAVGPVNGAPLM